MDNFKAPFEIYLNLIFICIFLPHGLPLVKNTFLKIMVIVVFLSVVGAIPHERQESLHHHRSLPAKETPPGQPNSDCPVCTGSSPARALTGNNPVKEVRWGDLLLWDFDFR